MASSNFIHGICHMELNRLCMVAVVSLPSAVISTRQGQVPGTVPAT